MIDGPPTLYLGISGVLHPSKSIYELLFGRTPEQDGHSEYEGVPRLERALRDLPSVRIVITSTQPWVHGLSKVLEQLGAPLASRVDGYTFEDLTTKVTRQVVMRSGATRAVGFSSNDYWRMSKAQIVDEHVNWRRPAKWMAIDDEDILWPRAVRQDRLVLTDGCVGLLSQDTQTRLEHVLRANFAN